MCNNLAPEVSSLLCSPVNNPSLKSQPLMYLYSCEENCDVSRGARGADRQLQGLGNPDCLIQRNTSCFEPFWLSSDILHLNRSLLTPPGGSLLTSILQLRQVSIPHGPLAYGYGWFFFFPWSFVHVTFSVTHAFRAASSSGMFDVPQSFLSCRNCDFPTCKKRLRQHKYDLERLTFSDVSEMVLNYIELPENCKHWRLMSTERGVQCN